jgi:LmbE family N-acetylglucosaminyl deacetylase
MAELVDTIPAIALALYAHPDDPEVSCGATLARWAKEGAAVHVVTSCLGEKGSLELACDPVALADRRAAEAAAASAVLGLASHRSLGYPDGEIDDSLEFRGRLVALIRELRPQVVVCPDPTAAFFGRSYVNHRDHRVIGWATLDAVAPAAWSPLYFPEAGPPHRVEAVYLSGTLEPDVWVNVTSTIDAKVEALLCHESQLGETGESLRTAVRERAEQAGRALGVRYAEGFRLLYPS